MNGLYTKLNIIRSNTLVKQGQLIYNNSSEGILTKDGKNLEQGLYLVASVQLTHSNEGCGDKKKKYLHNLELVGVNCDFENFSINSNRVQVSVDNSAFENNFGIGKQAKRGIFYELIKDQFEKVGKEGFDSKVDYDNIFKKIGWNLLHKLPRKFDEDEGQGIIMDIMLEIITPENVKKFDPKKDIVKYFSALFYNRMKNTFKHMFRQKRRELQVPVKEDDFTEEEQMEFRRPKEKDAPSPEEVLGYKELIKDLKNFIKGRVRAKEQLQMLEDMFQGLSSGEIAEKYDISSSLVSRYTNDLRDSIKEYAKKTNNNMLLMLMQQHSKKRMHSDEDINLIRRVLEDYKKRVGEKSIAEREPSGDKTKIKKTILIDKVSDKAIKEALLNDSYSSKKLKAELEEYFSILGSQDELIESSNGKLTGLKIISNEVRNIEDEAKCKQKKRESKKQGFFVYSKCGMGPHKVLKTDGTFSIKLNKNIPVKLFKSKMQAEKAASRYQHTKLVLKVGVYPDEYLKEDF